MRYSHVCNFSFCKLNFTTVFHFCLFLLIFLQAISYYNGQGLKDYDSIPLGNFICSTSKLLLRTNFCIFLPYFPHWIVGICNFLHGVPLCCDFALSSTWLWFLCLEFHTFAFQSTTMNLTLWLVFNPVLTNLAIWTPQKIWGLPIWYRSLIWLKIGTCATYKIWKERKKHYTTLGRKHVTTTSHGLLPSLVLSFEDLSILQIWYELTFLFECNENLASLLINFT